MSACSPSTPSTACSFQPPLRHIHFVPRGRWRYNLRLFHFANGGHGHRWIFVPRLNETVNSVCRPCSSDLRPPGIVLLRRISSRSGSAMAHSSRSKVPPVSSGRSDRQAVHILQFLDGGIRVRQRHQNRDTGRCAEGRDEAAPCRGRRPGTLGVWRPTRRSTESEDLGRHRLARYGGEGIGNFPSNGGIFNPRCSRMVGSSMTGSSARGSTLSRRRLRRDLQGQTPWVRLSPDESRVAFVSSDSRGHAIRWVAPTVAKGSRGDRRRYAVLAPLVECEGPLGRAAQRAEGDLDGAR